MPSNQTRLTLAFLPSSAKSTPFVAPLSSTLLAAAMLIWTTFGCSDSRSSPKSESPTSTPPVASSPQTDVSQKELPRPGGAWTESQIHAELARTNPQYNGQAQFLLEGGRLTKLALTGSGATSLASIPILKPLALDARQCKIEDLSPLRNLAIIQLYLEETEVKDLSPLADMPLQSLYLSHTQISDLSPLAGAPLVELNLLGTQVSDLSPLRGMPLRMLWLNETPVTSIAPLAGCPLVSLTLHRTLVRDLSPLAGSQLQRLHIGNTPVTDLTPLQGMHLTRLVFQPEQIQTGLEVVQRMASLREIGTTLEEVMPPHLFWARIAATGNSQ